MLKFYFDFFLFEGKTKLDDVRHKIFLKLEISDKFVIFKLLKILWFHNSINIFYASKKIFLENNQSQKSISRNLIFGDLVNLMLTTFFYR